MSRNMQSGWIFLLALLASFALASPTHASDGDDIRAVMMKTWNKPDAKLSVDPVVVADGYAVAGWSQGDMGGRALLRKKAGVWDVVLCAGDDLKKADLLVKAGMPDSAAKRLAADLAKSESGLSRERLALFSKFEGLVMMDAGQAHGNPHHGHKP